MRLRQLCRFNDAKDLRLRPTRHSSASASNPIPNRPIWLNFPYAFPIASYDSVYAFPARTAYRIPTDFANSACFDLRNAQHLQWVYGFTIQNSQCFPWGLRVYGLGGSRCH